MPENAKPSLLIVDDDPLITDTLSFALGKDFEVMVSDSRKHAVSLLRQLDDAPQLALVDLGLPPSPDRPDEGFQLISDLLAHSPVMKILVLSGQNEAANARHARSLGATEFVAKPCDPAKLKKILLHALQFRAAEISGEGAADTDSLIGKSPALLKLKSQVSQFADSPFPALIEGESGTGKELVANLLHRLSWRRSKPWFALNCAAIAPTLVEPTLFGHAKGAFTGALATKAGYFEDAGDGTLFLDEIGELPLEMQAKLLRVLENGEYQRVGETQQRFSRARVIAATNRDMRQEIKKNNFPRRPLPPALGLYHQRAAPARHGRRPQRAARALPQVLRRAGQAACVLAGRDCTEELARIPLSRQRARAAQYRHPPHHQIRGPETLAGGTGARIRPGGTGQCLARAALRSGRPRRTGAAPPAARAHFNLDQMLKAWEQGYIEAAMKLTRGNVSQAAKMLGINRTTLYSRMESHEKQQ